MHLVPHLSHFGGGRFFLAIPAAARKYRNGSTPCSKNPKSNKWHYKKKVTSKEFVSWLSHPTAFYTPAIILNKT
jgi:hypothetical protein